MKWILSLLLFFGSITASEKSFVFVIPSYNNAQWYEKNLDSVFSQNHDNYRVIYIDDASTDGTGDLVEEYIAQYGLEDRVTLIKNETNMGTLANIYKAVWMCDPAEIIINLDGDDWLAHPYVIEKLCAKYENPDVWLTYGQFIYYPKWQAGIGAPIPEHLIDKNMHRSDRYGTTPLRSFYAWLFHKIDKKDLCMNGEFFQAGADLAYMFPMLELSGRHSYYTPEVDYIYNIETGMNDYVINAEKQAEVDRWLRKKRPYEPLYNKKSDKMHKRVYITPGYVGELFSISNPTYNRDDCLRPFYSLREKAAELGIEILQADSVENLQDFDYLLVFEVFERQLPSLAKYPKEKLILCLWEPPSVIPQNYQKENHSIFSKVLTWHDDFIDNEKYFKIYYPVYLQKVENPVEFYWRRFATLIGGNKHSGHLDELYTARRKVIEFYEKNEEVAFDFYGRGWPNSYKNYQGPLNTKIDSLPYYKFNYAYENIKGVPGYVSEKIIDSFLAGVVPIYWGAPNITEYVPRGCFIDRRDFTSEEDLFNYLKTIDVRTYNTYLNNIKSFLNSEKGHRFSIEYFVETILSHIEGS